ncbi:MAG: hypothetical protein ACK40Q_06375, partial [Pseudothermotoga sp.]
MVCLSINWKMKSIRARKRSRTFILKIVIFIVLCFLSFIFAISYIRYQQCLSKNERLRSLYADLLVEL